ncbi:hypothetical protein U3516DRAFT_898820, partial [Neocallimastix sp. 'constans']
MIFKYTTYFIVKIVFFIIIIIIFSFFFLFLFLYFFFNFIFVYNKKKFVDMAHLIYLSSLLYVFSFGVSLFSGSGSSVFSSKRLLYSSY